MCIAPASYGGTFGSFLDASAQGVLFILRQVHAKRCSRFWVCCICPSLQPTHHHESWMSGGHNIAEKRQVAEDCQSPWCHM